MKIQNSSTSSRPQPENYVDVFTTFLYAVSIHLIVDHTDKHSIPSTLLALLMVIFVLMDWLSRVLLPFRLPQSDKQRELRLDVALCKSIFELCGVFFLTVAFSSSLENSELRHPAFAGFLFFTLGWNLLMLYIMNDLSWPSLWTMIGRGNAAESKHIAAYANPLMSILTRLKKHFNNLKKLKAIDPKKFLRKASHVLFLIAELRSMTQLVVNHLAWTSMLAASILIFKSNLVISHFNKIELFSKFLNELLMSASHFFLFEWTKNVIQYPFAPHASIIMGVLVLCFLRIPLTILAVPPTNPTVDKSSARLIPVTLQPAISLSILFFGFSFLGFFWQSAKFVFAFFAICIILPCPFYTLAEFFADKKRVRNFFFIIAGTGQFLLLLATYFVLQPDELMLFVALQQLTVVLFLYLFGDVAQTGDGGDCCQQVAPLTSD